MTTAFLFPGQGSQEPGMGRAFLDAWPSARRQFDALDDALSVDLERLCFDASPSELERPQNTQPALFAIGYATYAGVAEQFDPAPSFLAGHSLGHFTALGAAEMLSPSELVQLVRTRGECMQAAGNRAGPGAMVAVLLADPEDVADACARHDDVSVALYNSPRQTVISGTEDGVEAARETIEAETRARFRELDVGAAFHSPVMASAVDPVEEAMAEVTLSEASTPIVSDVSAEDYTSPGVARRDLTAQITSPIDWVGVVEHLKARGVERYVEFPPAGVLSELVGRIHPEAERIALETPADAREAFE